MVSSVGTSLPSQHLFSLSEGRCSSSGKDGLISHVISSVNPIVLLFCSQPRELFCCQFFTTTHLESYELPARVSLLKKGLKHV